MPQFNPFVPFKERRNIDRAAVVEAVAARDCGVLVQRSLAINELRCATFRGHNKHDALTFREAYLLERDRHHNR